MLDHVAGRGLPPRRAFAVVLASAALTQAGCAITSQQRDSYTFHPSFAVEDPQFRRSLDSVGNVMVGGNSAELLQNGDGVFPAMLRDIGEAKESVNLEMYIFTPDQAGRRFADAMIEA